MTYNILFGAVVGLSAYVGWHLTGHFINRKTK